jgi:hypothetical protein
MTAADDLRGVEPTNIRKWISPRWFAWRTKHSAEHLDCDDAHDSRVFSAGFLIGGDQATQLASQFNPALHDAVRLLLLMQSATEELSPQVQQAVTNLLNGTTHDLTDGWTAVRTGDLTALRVAHRLQEDMTDGH